MYYQIRTDSQCTEDGLPVHSFYTLIDDPATLMLNEVSLPGDPDAIMPMLSEPTRMKTRVLEMLGVTPEKTVPGAVTG